MAKKKRGRRPSPGNQRPQEVKGYIGNRVQGSKTETTVIGNRPTGRNKKKNRRTVSDQSKTARAYSRGTPGLSGGANPSGYNKVATKDLP